MYCKRMLQGGGGRVGPQMHIHTQPWLYCTRFGCPRIEAAAQRLKLWLTEQLQLARICLRILDQLVSPTPPQITIITGLVPWLEDLFPACLCQPASR